LPAPERNADARERLRGYRDARTAELGPDYVVSGDFSAASGYAAGLKLAALSPRPDAVFAANDMMAAGCLEAFTKLGLRVPEDIAIGGFDDVPLAHFLRPALTTMRVDVAELGRRAFERLAITLEQPDAAAVTDSIVPELVVRASCGRASGHTNQNQNITPGRNPE
jgi:LacI family transcriptional regulator